MPEQIGLLHMFSQYQPPEALKDTLSQVAITAADIDPDSRKIAVQLFCAAYIPKRVLDQVSMDI